MMLSSCSKYWVQTTWFKTFFLEEFMRKTTRLLALAFTVSLIGLSGSSLQTSSAQTTIAQTAGGAYYLPKGFKMTPFVSKTPVRSFKESKYVMKDNIDYQTVIETDAGRMVIDLFEDDTPTTVNSFIWLTLNHYYDGIAFHRVVEGFVVQGGDPNTLKPDSSGWGQGGPGYEYCLEKRKKLNFDSKGVIGMARTQVECSNGSQFYITLAPATNLNQQYTVFGKVTEGLNVLDKVVRGEPPAKPTRMKRVYIVQKKNRT
jgi:cyclophilin family peptidyl-prolyl cis-trans isomerase